MPDRICSYFCQPVCCEVKFSQCPHGNCLALPRKEQTFPPAKVWKMIPHLWAACHSSQCPSPPKQELFVSTFKNVLKYVFKHLCLPIINRIPWLLLLFFASATNQTFKRAVCDFILLNVGGLQPRVSARGKWHSQGHCHCPQSFCSREMKTGLAIFDQNCSRVKVTSSEDTDGKRRIHG